jgi:hypothetical protein
MGNLWLVLNLIGRPIRQKKMELLILIQYINNKNIPGEAEWNQIW